MNFLIENLEKFQKRVGNQAKSLIAIGGSSVKPSLWSAVTMWDLIRAEFVQSIVSFLDKFHFDGVMIDWQWPGVSDGDGTEADSYDREYYIKLLSDLKKAFQPKGYVLGVTGPGSKDPFDAGIDAVRVAE